jgi:hypothetical protein
MALYVGLDGSCKIVNTNIYQTAVHTLIKHDIGLDFNITECENFTIYTPGINALNINPVATQIMNTIGFDGFVYGNAIFTGKDNARLSIDQLTKLQVFGKLD